MNTVKTNPLQEFSTELKFKGFDSESESESSSSSSRSQDEDLKVEVKTLETTETLNLKMIGDSDFYSKVNCQTCLFKFERFFYNRKKDKIQN